MNINLKMNIPLVNAEGEEQTIRLDSSLFLTPFYCIEEDILHNFPEATEEDLPLIRRVIFNASLKVNRLTSRVEDLKLLVPKALFALRRDYVICLATSEIAKKFNTNLVKARTQSKTLGDFSVSTSQTNDNTVLSKIFADSSQCVLDIEQLLKEAEQDLILPVDLVKGRYNASNIQANDRLWWLKDLDGGSRVVDGYASNKFWYNGNRYKSATLNRSSLSSNTTVLDYYRRGNT